MKIAYLFSRYPVPSQTFCDTEIRALEALGHEVVIYSCSPPTTSFRHGPEEWPRAEVFYAPPTSVLDAWEAAARTDGTWPGAMVAGHLARFGLRYDPARRARHALYFADRLRRHGVEHVHVHFANRATHAALFLHALTGVPFSFTAHAQDFLVDLGSDELLGLMCDQAAFVVAVSDWSRQALVERCPTSAAKIHRVYNGLPLERWPYQWTGESSSAPPWVETPLKIFSVGRLIEFKGFHDLITACHNLRERNVPFSCEIAGEGPWRERLEQQAADLDDPRFRVQLSGLLTQAEVRARLAACDVFALACRVDEKGACDVLPTVILEAMAMAKPVVSTKLAAIPEMVDQARTGWLLPAGDTDGLANVLANAATTRKHELVGLGFAGRQKLEEQFSAADSARQLSVLFERSTRTQSSARAAPSTSLDQSPLLCLLDHWPLEDVSGPAHGFSPASLSHFWQRYPRTETIALQPASQNKHAAGSGVIDPRAIHRLDYLPDDVVFETYWRAQSQEAYRLEQIRTEVGGIPVHTFLLAARRALYLSHLLRSRGEPFSSLHAVGPESILCAFLLSKLQAVAPPSFLLLPQLAGGVGIAGSTLRKMASAFAWGWTVNERKLAASLGANFRGDAFSADAWVEQNARAPVSC